jgi:hypothetical protein
MLVKILNEVPDELFFPAMQEISEIDWEQFQDNVRAIYGIFSSSRTIILRKHKLGNRPVPQTIEDWCTVIECEDNPMYADKFLNVRKLANWVFDKVNGISCGKIMIVNLAQHGKVSLHIDPNDYFEHYSRFHIPFKTNKNIVFHGTDSIIVEHMPYKNLCQLNNRKMHGLTNNSNENRIHLILDIAVEGGNKIF